MTNFLHNIDPKMVAGMQPTTSEDTTSLPLDAIDAKTDHAGQVILNPPQTDHSKCWSCKRKVGLLGFKCHCKYTFCSKHRDASTHECTFDFRAANKSKLQEQLQPCVGDKLTRI